MGGRHVSEGDEEAGAAEDGKEQTQDASAWVCGWVAHAPYTISVSAVPTAGGMSLVIWSPAGAEDEYPPLLH